MRLSWLNHSRHVAQFALLGLLSAGCAQADTVPVVTWPANWDVQVLPAVLDAKGQPIPGVRQRAVKSDAGGNPVMIIELTQSRVQPDHQVNLHDVLLEMRKSVQVNFMHGGYQSACTHFRETTLSRLPALQTTCQISLNGGHVMTQTLVAAVGKADAYAFAYAGSADQYEASSSEIDSVRDSLNLE